MFLAKTPKIVKQYSSNLIWDIPNNERTIYLTFDDGPTPEITEWVLNILNNYNIKATFFCVGSNVAKHPHIYQQIIHNKHAVGNHSHHHLNGWHTKSADYLRNIEKCNQLLNTTIFRPPYGRIKPTQIKALQQQYKIIMWDVLSGDFDSKITSEKCLKNVISNTKSGSIIVFHDSLKAANNLKNSLPKAIDFLLENNFTFGKITNEIFC